MRATQRQDVFSYAGKDMAQFRLCADRFGDRGEKIYRLYCPYVAGGWEFSGIGEMAASLDETVSAMRRGDAPEDVFSAERGIRDIVLGCSPEVWEQNMLHTKRGSFYSAYIGFWIKDDSDKGGILTIVDTESETRRTSLSEAFATSEELCAAVAGIERVYAEAHSAGERRRLFRKYAEQRKKSAG